jgi:hypothetical protein
MQDTNLSLRDVLKAYLSGDAGHKLKERWTYSRKAADEAHNIQIDDSVLNKVRSHCVSISYLGKNWALFNFTSFFKILNCK